MKDLENKPQNKSSIISKSMRIVDILASSSGSCPDGSEPVKSISDDGTYFVYNCGGNRV